MSRARLTKAMRDPRRRSCPAEWQCFGIQNRKETILFIIKIKTRILDILKHTITLDLRIVYFKRLLIQDRLEEGFKKLF